MTRREGTSKSNCFCAVGGFAPKVGWTQIYGWYPKIDHSSGSNRSILVLRLLLCTSFWCGPAWSHPGFQNICFRWVLVRTRSSMETHFFKNWYFYNVFIDCSTFFEASRRDQGWIGLSGSPGGPHKPRERTRPFQRTGGAFSTSLPPQKYGWRFTAGNKYGWYHKIDHSSGSNRSILVLRLLLCTSFWCGPAWSQHRFQGNCFRWVLVRTGSGMETQFLKKHIFFISFFIDFSTFFQVTRRDHCWIGLSISPRGPRKPRERTRPFRRAGGGFSMSLPPREPWLTVHRGQQVSLGVWLWLLFCMH